MLIFLLYFSLVFFFGYQFIISFATYGCIYPCFNKQLTIPLVATGLDGAYGLVPRFSTSRSRVKEISPVPAGGSQYSSWGRPNANSFPSCKKLM